MNYKIFKNANICHGVNDYVIINTDELTYTHELIRNKDVDELLQVLDVNTLSEKESVSELTYINKFEFYGTNTQL